jgi:hypothetical protein
MCAQRSTRAVLVVEDEPILRLDMVETFEAAASKRSKLRQPLKQSSSFRGKGASASSDTLSRLIAERPSLLRILLQYAHTVSVQQDETALAAARGNIPERLARWLLMAQDRLGDELDLTHEFLAIMLGIRLPRVTSNSGRRASQPTAAARSR